MRLRPQVPLQKDRVQRAGVRRPHPWIDSQWHASPGDGKEVSGRGYKNFTRVRSGRVWAPLVTHMLLCSRTSPSMPRYGFGNPVSAQPGGDPLSNCSRAVACTLVSGGYPEGKAGAF